MAGRDVAVWIPVVPHELRSGKSESFRLLILAGPEKQDGLGPTKLITAPRRYLSDAKQEALIAYFGDLLSWPPLPAPLPTPERRFSSWRSSTNASARRMR